MLEQTDNLYRRRVEVENEIRDTKEILKSLESNRDYLNDQILNHFVEEGLSNVKTKLGYTIYTKNSSYVGKKDYCDETKIALDHPDLVNKKIDLKQVQEILEAEGESELKTELEKYYYLSSSPKITLRKV